MENNDEHENGCGTTAVDRSIEPCTLRGDVFAHAS
jgi:hypothetical protein